MGILYELKDRPGLVRKHMAIAKVKKMVELGNLPNQGGEKFNPNDINLKHEIPDWKNTVTKDQNMEANENDSLYLDLIEFLLQRNLKSTSNALLKYIQG